MGFSISDYSVDARFRDETRRIIVWFSCGAASAVAGKLILNQFGHDRVTFAYCETGGEHEDNERFISDCEAWYGQKIVRIRSDEYKDVWDIWIRRKYLRGPSGAPCTSFLKVAPRIAFQRPSDIHIFGYTHDGNDIKRAKNFRENFPELLMITPLIDAEINKQATLALLMKANIELPAMYNLGFNNNNCKTCVKSSSPGYWSLVRQSFPDDFERMSKLSQGYGVRLIRIKGERIFLHELEADYPVKDPIAPACDFMCHRMESELISLGVEAIDGLCFDEDRIQEDQQELRIGIERRKEEKPRCQFCGCDEVVGNGARRVTYRDRNVGQKQVFLECDRQRYICKQCAKTSPDLHPEFREDHQMTDRLFREIQMASKSKSNSQIARELGLHEKTIRNVLRSSQK